METVSYFSQLLQQTFCGAVSYFSSLQIFDGSNIFKFVLNAVILQQSAYATNVLCTVLQRV